MVEEQVKFHTCNYKYISLYHVYQFYVTCDILLNTIRFADSVLCRQNESNRNTQTCAVTPFYYDK